MAMHIPQEEEREGEVQEQALLVEKFPGWKLMKVPLIRILLPPDTPGFVTSARKLSKSIKNFGMLQLPRVQPEGEDLFGNTIYRAVFGRRRLRAAKILAWEEQLEEWEEVWVLVYDEELTGEQALLAAREENFRRSDDFGATVWELYELLHEVGISESELPGKLMVAKGTLEKYLKLVRMPRPLVECIRDGRMNQAVSNKAARLPRQQQKELAETVETLLATLEGEEVEAFKVTEEMVTALRVERRELAEFLSRPLIPDGVLESMQAEKEEQTIYAPAGLPTPAEMKHYLRGYRAVLSGNEPLIDSLIAVLDQVYVAQEKGERDE